MSERRTMSVQDLLDDGTEERAAASPAELFGGPAAANPPSERQMLKDFEPPTPMPSGGRATARSAPAGIVGRDYDPADRRFQAPAAPPQVFDDRMRGVPAPAPVSRVAQPEPVDVGKWATVDRGLSPQVVESLERYFLAGERTGQQTPLWMMVAVLRVISEQVGALREWTNQAVDYIQRLETATVDRLTELRSESAMVSDGLKVTAQRLRGIVEFQQKLMVPTVAALAAGLPEELYTDRPGGKDIADGPMRQIIEYVFGERTAPREPGPKEEEPVEPESESPQPKLEEPTAPPAPPAPAPEPLLTIGEVAKLVGRNVQTVDRWVKRGRFPGPMTSNPRQWDKQQVAAWFVAGGMSTKEE